MNAADLSTEQLQTLLARTERDLEYYARLRQRMEEQRFNQDDPIYVAVNRTHGELQGLRMLLHYAEIDGRRVR